MGICESIVNSLYDALFFLDRNGKFLFWNNAAQAITGYEKEEILGSVYPNSPLKFGDENGKIPTLEHCPIRLTLNDGNIRKEEMYMSHKAGYRVPCTLKITPLRNVEGVIAGVIVIFVDNFTRVLEYEKMKALAKMALFDTLTGVPNRQYMDMKFGDLVEKRDHTQKEFGAMIIAIDNLKSYTGNLGSRVLKTIARTIHDNITEQSFMGRWEREFFLILMDPANQSIMSNLASRIKMNIKNAAFKDGDYIVNMSVSIVGTMSLPNESKEALMDRLFRKLNKTREEGIGHISID